MYILKCTWPSHLFSFVSLFYQNFAMNVLKEPNLSFVKI